MVLCLSETRYPTFQRCAIFMSLASLCLWKDAKDKLDGFLMASHMYVSNLQPFEQ